ncbi:hypothetical protein HK102_002845 [Quaeritorhiza haematococci]|nr:hypothetical protein HK102_002845 [Quaeritorhiza haematococci]
MSLDTIEFAALDMNCRPAYFIPEPWELQNNTCQADLKSSLPARSLQVYWAYLIACLVIVITSAFVLQRIHSHTERVKEAKRKAQKQRRMSFISQLMAENPLPKSAGIPDVSILGLIHMKQLPPIDELKKLFEERLLKYHRFTHIAKRDQYGEFVWQECPNFDLDHHIIQRTVPSSTDLQSYIQSILSRNWDESRPLWFAHVITNDEPNGLSAIVFEVHHAIADGLSAVKLALELVTDSDGRTMTLNDMKFGKNTGKKQRPTLVATAKKMATALAGIPIAYGRVAILPFFGGDSRHQMKEGRRRYDPNRSVVFLPPVALDAIKQIKNHLGVTVNDVVVGILAGAIRRYLTHRGDPLFTDPQKSKNVQIRALLPYSFQRPDDGDQHNEWGLVSASLPVSSRYATPRDRVFGARQVMNALKSRPEPHAYKHFLWLMHGILPDPVFKWISLGFMRKHSLTFTNVPGFPNQVYMCGLPIEQLHPVVTTINSMVALLSYNGALHMSLTCNEKVVTEPEEFCKFFVEEFKELASDCGIEDADLLRTRWTEMGTASTESS